MGETLAKEIKEYLNVNLPGNVLGKVSFICHSLGGLIVRAALPYMPEL